MNNPFLYLNEYYDKVYVLSVNAAHERRAKFESLFKGLKYDFYFGADKSNFTIDDLERNGVFSDKLTRKHHRFSKSMRAGEIACSWSHRMIYEDMLQQGFEKILIFEDDAVPDLSQFDRIPEILKEMPEDCELLFWGWDKYGKAPFYGSFKKAIYHIQHSIGRLKWDHSVIRNLYAKPHSKHFKKAGFHDYTYAYAINRSAAQKLINMQTPLQFIADNLLAHATTKGIVNGYITWPRMFLHDTLPDGSHVQSYIR